MIYLSDETENLAQRLAVAQNVSVDTAVRQALEARARITPELRRPKDCSPTAIAARRARMNRLVAEMAALPLLDPRSTQEIVEDLNAL